MTMHTPASSAAPAAPHAWSARGVRWGLTLALLGTACLVDMFASGAFDAPKRLAALLGAGIAFLAWVWPMRPATWRDASRRARTIALLALAALLGVILSAWLAPGPNTAGESLRVLVLYALFLPLGASGAVAASRRWLFGVTVLGVGVNAALSLLQALGIARLPIAQLGGRFASGALLGNEGYVAIACALLGAACCAVALNTASARHRILAIALGVAALAVIAINQQLTAAIALALAVATLLAIRLRARWLVGLGCGALLLALCSAALPPLRAATWGAVADVHAYQRLSTSRIAAWAAADDMVRARPLAGFGPGSYAARAQTHRLQAELRIHERLTPPVTAAAFVFAHNDYLQLAAESGVPVLLLALAAFGLLLAGLLRRARSPGAIEPLLLLGVLVAGGIAALAWFPLQVPFTAVLLLLACGRAWRIVADAAA